MTAAELPKQEFDLADRRAGGAAVAAGAAAASSARACRLLAFAPNTWDGQWMNRQQLLSRLAKIHQVVYTTGPWSIWHRDKPDYDASDWLGRFERCDGVWVDHSPKLLLGWPTKPAWDRLAQCLVVARWRRQLASMGSGPVISYVFHPMYGRYVDQVRADMLVYHPYDLFSQMPDWTEADTAGEDRLLARCSFAVASSEPTREALQRRTDRPVFCIPNGVDAELFIAGAAQAAPADIAKIPHPRIGYVGSLNRKVDFGLVAELAVMEPSWQFVLMGPAGSMDDVSRSAVERCRQLPNIHFMDWRLAPELPAFMGALDVGLMCYRRDTWMDFGYPLKLHEYLAAGLPVVSTPLPSIRDLHRWIDTAESVVDWHAAIDRNLKGRQLSSADERRQVARCNTWDMRVASLQSLIASALDGRLPAPVPPAEPMS